MVRTYRRYQQQTDDSTPATKQSIATLQAQIANLTTAVAALTRQRTASVLHNKRNNQVDNNDEFEEDANPLARLRHQPHIRNNNNDSYLDNKYADLDTIFDATKDNKNSYVVLVGGPVFDDDREIFSSHIDPSYGLSNKDGKQYNEDSFVGEIGDPTFDVVDNDDTEVGPIYDIFEADDFEQITAGKVEDESVNFIDTVCAQVTLTFSHDDFATSHGVVGDLSPKDVSPAFQTMLTTVGWKENIFLKSSMSNKREYHIDDLKPELVRACNESDESSLMNLQRTHMNYGVCRINSTRKINREPPDRNIDISYADHGVTDSVVVPRCSNSKLFQEDTHFLKEKIIHLQKELVLEQEKNQFLEHELRETHKKIRMLNTGSATLDKILSMGRIEKTTAGLGYQGAPSGSHTVFVRTNSVETNKTDAVLESARKTSYGTPTVSNVYTRYCEISPSQHQRCLRQKGSTEIMSVWESISSHWGEEFIRILQQRSACSRTGKRVFPNCWNLSSDVDAFLRQSIGKFSNLHRVCRRLFQQEDEKHCEEEDHYLKWVRIFPSSIESAADLIQSRGRRDMQSEFYRAQVIIMVMPTVFQLYIMWCFTCGKFGEKNSLSCHHLQHGFKLVLTEMFEQKGSVFALQLHCLMQKDFDLYKLVNPLLVNKHMLECTRLCVAFLTYSESFWIASINDKGRSNIYNVKFDGRCILLFLELLISLLLVSVIGPRQRKKDSCTDFSEMWCSQSATQNMCDVVQVVIFAKHELFIVSWELVSSYGEYTCQHELSFVFHLNTINNIVMCLMSPLAGISSSIVVGNQRLVHPHRKSELNAIAVHDSIYKGNIRNVSLNFWPLAIDKALWSSTHMCTTLPRVVFHGISFYAGCGAFMSGIRFICSPQMDSIYTSTKLPCWSIVTCTSSELLCVLDKDVSFRRIISFSWRGSFECVHIFSHDMVDSMELKMLLQHLDKFYNISWLCGDLLTCNQFRYATYGQIKFLGEDVENSAESVAETTRLLLWEVWEQRFCLNDSMTKTTADVRRRHLVFDVGDLVWPYFTRDHMPAHTYNKLESKKVVPLVVLEIINDNAYRLKLHADINTSDIFTVKHQSRYVPTNTCSDSGSNPSNPGSPDAAASLSLAPT